MGAAPLNLIISPKRYHMNALEFKIWRKLYCNNKKNGEVWNNDKGILTYYMPNVTFLSSNAHLHRLHPKLYHKLKL